MIVVRSMCGVVCGGVLSHTFPSHLPPTHSCGTWDMTWGGGGEEGSGSMWLGGYVDDGKTPPEDRYHSIDHHRGREYHAHADADEHRLSTGVSE